MSESSPYDAPDLYPTTLTLVPGGTRQIQDIN